MSGRPITRRVVPLGAANRAIIYKINPATRISEREAFALRSAHVWDLINRNLAWVNPDGGGAINNNAVVNGTPFVAAGALIDVHDSAINEDGTLIRSLLPHVGSKAVIEGSAVVYGRVINTATVRDNAIVGPDCTVKNQAVVGDHAQLWDGCEIFDRVRVGEYSRLECLRVGGKGSLMFSKRVTISGHGWKDALIIGDSNYAYTTPEQLLAYRDLLLKQARDQLKKHP